MKRVLLLGLGLALAGLAQPPSSYPSLGKIIREDSGLDDLIAPGTPIQVLAAGFDWSEGPVWDRKGGYLLFSDIPRNSVMKWSEKEGISLYLKPSGYTGPAAYGREPGSNGLVLDAQGHLISMEHGDRRVSILTPEGGKRTLVDNYQGKRLNSPNDGVLHSNGDVYFTDPPYGLPGNVKDPRKELDFQGVYRYSPKTGAVTLLTSELSRPNGIDFSPDEKTLYVANSDPARAIWMAYPVNSDGTLGKGRVFADVTSMVGSHKGLPDGLKVDARGNVWATAPGGVHVYAPDGKRLGRLETFEATANCAWGGDGSTLYITADMYLCRIQTKVKGRGW